MKFDYHFEPIKGWLNDPNGLSYYKGQYHAFFQYNPYSPEWDTMHWGHAVSTDLLNWKQIETALYPDKEYENDGGCWSGSAIEHNDELYLMYTGVSKEYGQAQCIAKSSDGINFVKHADNPIIKYSPYCVNGRNSDFRDPKLFKAFDKYYAVVAYGKDTYGEILIYSSNDLINWTFESVAYASDEYAGTLECPDMYKIGDTWVLMFSAIKPKVAKTVYISGDFDGKNFTPKDIYHNEIGGDFYAPQTLSSPDGRRIMIAWMYHWGKPLPQGATVAGALTVARELFFKDGLLYNYPVKEVRHLLKNTCEYVKIDGTTVKIYGLNGEVVFKKDVKGLNGVTSIDKVDILFDKKAVEIFINGGIISIAQWLI